MTAALEAFTQVFMGIILNLIFASSLYMYYQKVPKHLLPWIVLAWYILSTLKAYMVRRLYRGFDHPLRSPDD